jgi:hypothetical protein
VEADIYVSNLVQQSIVNSIEVFSLLFQYGDKINFIVIGLIGLAFIIYKLIK